MTQQEAETVALFLVARHGRGASLIAYQHVVRTMEGRDRGGAEAWCLVLLAVEEALTRA